MSDWDIFAPVDGQANGNEGKDETVNDGIFFGDPQNDDFGNAQEGQITMAQSPTMTPRSFNNRYSNENGRRRDMIRHRGDFNRNHDYNNFRGDMSHSYTNRKIHVTNEDFERRRNRSRRNSMNRRRRNTNDSDVAMASVPHNLLEGGFDEQKYQAFHDYAKQQRYKLGIGKALEMNSLYYFWCYYLRDHFDQKMFEEFRETARQDAIGKSHYGIECFFRFCSYGLEKRWDENVFKIFQDEALKDNKNGSTYGLEKVKSFLIHQKYDFPIEPTPEMKAVLDKYPTLESFKEERQNKKEAPKNSSPSFPPPHLEARRHSKIDIVKPTSGEASPIKITISASKDNKEETPA